MRGEKRTEQLNIKTRPTVKAIIRADAAAKGQSIAGWLERLVEDTVIKKKQFRIDIGA